ncbi:H-NS family nucleoid-associated regulatory protein [Halomonas casei]|uniref:H-NS histone family protein n=1 Tax=Halomonas casei TaxID=2742613 RepID=UPI003CEE4FB6
MSSPKPRASIKNRSPEGDEPRIPVTKIEFVPLNAQAQAGKTTAKAKYQDPENPFHSWTGVGTRPKWLRHYLNQGRQLSDFLIHEEGDR